MERLSGTAIVTGGAVRLGRALSLALAEAGMDVCVHYASSAAAAREVVERIQGMGRRSMAIHGDFLAGTHVAREVVDAAVQELGDLRVLVNSAAIFESCDLLSCTPDQFERHVHINMRGPLLLAQAFAHAVHRRRDGRDDALRYHIVNMVDWRALRPPVGHLVYTMTKAAVVAMTRILALELAPSIRVNAIAPGAILPPPGAGPEYAERAATRIPLRSLGTERDIEQALLYLLRSEFVTGEVLCVTGGEHL